jgi:hypothetical protein
MVERWRVSPSNAESRIHPHFHNLFGLCTLLGKYLLGHASRRNRFQRPIFLEFLFRICSPSVLLSRHRWTKKRIETKAKDIATQTSPAPAPNPPQYPNPTPRPPTPPHEPPPTAPEPPHLPATPSTPQTPQPESTPEPPSAPHTTKPLPHPPSEAANAPP